MEKSEILISDEWTTIKVRKDISNVISTYAILTNQRKDELIDKILRDYFQPINEGIKNLRDVDIFKRL